MKKLGVLIITGEFGCDEVDTFTCGHCNNIKLVPPKQRAEDIGGHCSVCWQLICPGCVSRGLCDPFEKKLKRAEDRARTRQSYGI
jgi:hypothetical protein